MRTVKRPSYPRGLNPSEGRAVWGLTALVWCVVFLVSGAALAADPTPPPPASGRDANSEQAVLPADVLARVHLLRAELDLVRRELGARKVERPPFPVADAAPREVYFQALTLFRKSDRFCFEQVGVAAQMPVTPSAESIRPVHVYHLVNRAHVRILLIKEELGIVEKTVEATAPTTTTPTDVFRAIVAVNQQLNELLSERISASDVYQEVTEGVHLAAALLAHFPGARRIPEPPPFARRKTPIDVFGRLLAVFELLGVVAEKSGVKMITVDAAQYGAGATHGDLFDVATLIVSELSYLHSKLPRARKPMPAYYPGRRTPSHVFQRVGLLETQLATLRDLVAAQPNWLR
jgi:hypothetical protein